MPQKVKELDALIDRHLKEIGAVVPAPNPAYNPKAAAQVQGWRAGGTCSLSVKEGVLRVESTGGDPHFHTGDVPRVAGAVTVRVRMKCKTAGAAQVFWTTGQARRFHRSRSVHFAIRHDGQWHEYEAALPIKGTMTALRLDPGTAPGTIEIDWIRLAGPDGTGLKQWEFAAPAGKRRN